MAGIRVNPPGWRLFPRDYAEDHYFALAQSPDGEYVLFFSCGWGSTGFYAGGQVRPWPLALARAVCVGSLRCGL